MRGETADGREHRFSWAELSALPRVTVASDLHCVTRFSVLDTVWTGVAARTLLERVPPARDVRHVLVWAEHGYSANLRLADFASPDSVLATHQAGAPLSPERGWPLRLVVPHLYAYKGPKWVREIEYLTDDRRGFWEERGYHDVGPVWREERYSYQE